MRTDPDHAEIQKLREENAMLTAQVRSSTLSCFVSEPSLSLKIICRISFLNVLSEVVPGNSSLAWRTRTGCSALALKLTEGTNLRQQSVVGRCLLSLQIIGDLD